MTTTQELLTFNFRFNEPPVTVPPIDLTKALNRTDLTFNLNLNRNDTMAFSSFARAIQMANRLIFRLLRPGDREETTLIRAFLEAEGLLHEHGPIDPRMPYIFAELLTSLDEYDYALDCLKTLEAALVIHSPDVTLAISEVQQFRARRVHQSHQGMNF